jgi:hypothetical protein
MSHSAEILEALGATGFEVDLASAKPEFPSRITLRKSDSSEFCVVSSEYQPQIKIECLPGEDAAPEDSLTYTLLLESYHGRAGQDIVVIIKINRYDTNKITGTNGCYLNTMKIGSGRNLDRNNEWWDDLSACFGYTFRSDTSDEGFLYFEKT